MYVYGLEDSGIPDLIDMVVVWGGIGRGEERGEERGEVGHWLFEDEAELVPDEADECLGCRPYAISIGPPLSSSSFL